MLAAMIMPFYRKLMQARNPLKETKHQNSNLVLLFTLRDTKFHKDQHRVQQAFPSAQCFDIFSKTFWCVEALSKHIFKEIEPFLAAEKGELCDIYS